MFPTIHEEIEHDSRAQDVIDYASFMLETDGRVRCWNLGSERLNGYAAADVIGRNFSMFYTAEDRAAGIPERNLELARVEGHVEGSGWRVRKDGSRFRASIVIDAIHENGELAGFAKITRDCTERSRHPLANEGVAGKLRTALSFLPDAACLVNAEHRVTLFNPAFRELFGAAGEGERLVDAIRKSGPPQGFGALEPKTALAGLFDTVEAASCEVALGCTTFAVRKRSVDGHGWLLFFEPMGERPANGSTVGASSGTDILVKLADRNELAEHLRATIALCSGDGNCAVLHLDLDGFRLVNDTMGRRTGEAVLTEAAYRILGVLRPEDFVCWLGGGEFIVVPQAPIAPDDVLRVAERLRENLREPLVHKGRSVQLELSIGIAVSRGRQTTDADLVAEAELALGQARRDGPRCIRLFDQDLGLSALKRRNLEMQLCQALEAGEFHLVFQPFCSASSGATKGFEALLRWQRPDGASIPPTEFIPVAEELGIMAEIGGWVLEAACREAAAWPRHLVVSVNVSATQMQDPRLLDRIAAALDTSGLDAARLEIEITETAMIVDHASTLAVLIKARALGVSIAIDDFGTGYSSLSFLHTLPFTRVKIDRSFVADIMENPNSLAIVRGVMRMSHELGLRVTAEGVETGAQRDVLLSEGCEDLQGYLFARPMVGSLVREFLSSRDFPPIERSA